MPHHIAIILLAAGGSSRFGSPKQLAPFKGTTLLRHITQVALQSNAAFVSVVLGAEVERMKAELSELPVQFVVNAQWQDGIGLSIGEGIRSLPKATDAALILLGDQPLITVELLNSIIEKYITTGKPIVASAYSNTLGVPALFARSLFPELLLLRDDKGAKAVIHNHHDDAIRIVFPAGSVDIDSPDDLPQTGPQ
ncbi:MAG: nucleotidyltransferase family protein [Ignavibacteriae bacterium]|nr:nucleotidyltransferase family protein [Ignavibacteriota bacterium]MCI0707910.1 nucleotidyltransferase family protein [Ignavibacteriota bacterium]